MNYRSAVDLEACVKSAQIRTLTPLNIEGIGTTHLANDAASAEISSTAFESPGLVQICVGENSNGDSVKFLNVVDSSRPICTLFRKREKEEGLIMVWIGEEDELMVVTWLPASLGYYSYFPHPKLSEIKTRLFYEDDQRDCNFIVNAYVCQYFKKSIRRLTYFLFVSGTD